ncbi:tetratricopeptide repeat protein [Flavobacteriaceae bacterium R33]|uniref:histidine kinase n=2 Tax=Poritiphilus flavus TaxID=2697053 RepID=A0A6L9EEG8_9FLAO|nr:tetratricopeptide repeat protein [Poritiphilus flavus]
MAIARNLRYLIVPLAFWVCYSGMLHAQETERDSLINELRRLESQKGFTENDSTYVSLLNELAWNYRFFKTDSLLLLSEKALKISRNISYKKGEGCALLRLGDYYSDKGNNNKAIEYYQAGLKIANEVGEGHLILRIMNNLAGEYAYKSDYAKALTGYLDAIDKAEELNNLEMLSILNENVANLYASQKDYTQALEFYKKVRKINTEIGDPVIMAETNSNLASLYADMGDLEYAMFYVNKSITTFEKERIMDWLAFAYETKGKVYLKQDKFQWALFWYNQSDLLHKNLDDDRSRIGLLNGMAEAYLGQGKDSISQKHALEAFEISSRIKFLEGTQKCAKTLYKINKNKKDFATALTYHELYQKLSDTLSRNENKKSLTMLKTKNEYELQKQALITENEKALAQQRQYVNAALAILLVFIVVTFLVHRGQKIQRKLNVELKTKQQKLKVREAELQDSNETKTKLFSIIGHDLRGPIGALQGLLKMFNDGEIQKSEFLEFIPKLNDDVDHIYFTLNNLLSWGYTQMNGAVTKPSVVAMDSLVTENINLLSEIAKKKSIKVISKIPENAHTWSDTNQIDIVIRNLISNALKFTPENGMVTIAASEKNDHWEISVRDTGVGMDRITVEKLFSKNSNITTYGTNNEKGTGLGLSLCKEMVEKNNGKIWVDSVLRKGSSFFFTLPKPKAEKNYSQAS